MKIKDCVVIELNLLESLLDDFNKCMIENGNSKVERKIINNHIVVINKIINKTNPLELIVRDAFNNGVNTGNDYANNISPYYGNDTNYIDETEI
jgi:hypothetical protein